MKFGPSRNQHTASVCKIGKSVSDPASSGGHVVGERDLGSSAAKRGAQLKAAGAQLKAAGAQLKAAGAQL